MGDDTKSMHRIGQEMEEDLNTMLEEIEQKIDAKQEEMKERMEQKLNVTLEKIYQKINAKLEEGNEKKNATEVKLKTFKPMKIEDVSINSLRVRLSKFEGKI